jgi:hypothetical protein
VIVVGKHENGCEDKGLQNVPAQYTNLFMQSQDETEVNKTRGEGDGEQSLLYVENF